MRREGENGSSGRHLPVLRRVPSYAFIARLLLGRYFLLQLARLGKEWN